MYAIRVNFIQPFLRYGGSIFLAICTATNIYMYMYKKLKRYNVFERNSCKNLYPLRFPHVGTLKLLSLFTLHYFNNLKQRARIKWMKMIIDVSDKTYEYMVSFYKVPMATKTRKKYTCMPLTEQSKLSQLQRVFWHSTSLLFPSNDHIGHQGISWLDYI